MLAISTVQFQFIFPQGTLAHLAPDPKGIGVLVPFLSKHSLLPSISEVIEIHPHGPKKANSLDLIAADKSWLIDLSPDRIRFELRLQQNGNTATSSASRSDNGFLEHSCAKAIEALGDLLELAPVQANRLALLANGSTQDDGRQAHFTPPETRIQFYEQNGTIEWSSRRLARVQKTIGEVQEQLNVITDLSSTESGDHADKLSRRIYAFDINTWQHSTELRFGIDEAAAFAKTAQDLVLEIGGQVAKLQ